MRLATFIGIVSITLAASRTHGAAPQARLADAPPEKVRIELPQGWQAKAPISSKAVQWAEYPDLTAYFELIEEAKADFADNIDLMAWAKLVKENSTKGSKLANRTETELKEGKIGKQPTVEYEITGEIRGVKLRYRIIMVQFNGWFCKIICWTTPSHWTAAQPKFEELVSHLK